MYPAVVQLVGTLGVVSVGQQAVIDGGGAVIDGGGAVIENIKVSSLHYRDQIANLLKHLHV